MFQEDINIAAFPKLFLRPFATIHSFNLCPKILWTSILFGIRFCYPTMRECKKGISHKSIEFLSVFKG